MDSFPSFLDALSTTESTLVKSHSTPLPICDAVLLEQQQALDNNRSERYQLRPSGVSFQSASFRRRTQEKIHELIRTATAATPSPDVCSANALLAQRTLKYRRVLERQSVYSTTSMPCRLSYH
ncbi:unnamed protein product [Hyaloperonospora brassicae]|uniref:Uncharacterized protein n=1 Tax=Hyaloperonospora brassicae TaxID=162125 RepID=A0AAV0V223_HYABA|nr:unnamed protein product [Hyaloperonospora brassicae]